MSGREKRVESPKGRSTCFGSGDGKGTSQRLECRVRHCAVILGNGGLNQSYERTTSSYICEASLILVLGLVDFLDQVLDDDSIARHTNLRLNLEDDRHERQVFRRDRRKNHKINLTSIKNTKKGTQTFF